GVPDRRAGLRDLPQRRPQRQGHRGPPGPGRRRHQRVRGDPGLGRRRAARGLRTGARVKRGPSGRSGSRPGDPDGIPAPRPIEDEPGLAELVRVLADQPAYALDTEFHRERTYFPKVALLQLAWDGGLALVDPLAVPLDPLAEVLDGPGTAVLHAA